ncbi:hypothetical protein [Paramicrobacterium humi]|uniref:hypothetical protein n=1 Tax=Paramicrobacterium humi TaxID=640635 RepID=UPI001C408F9E|nr:hypothetical protein [Microbacterium humi]
MPPARVTPGAPHEDPDRCGDDERQSPGDRAGQVAGHHVEQEGDDADKQHGDHGEHDPQKPIAGVAAGIVGLAAVARALVARRDLMRDGARRGFALSLTAFIFGALVAALNLIPTLGWQVFNAVNGL